MKDNCCNFLFFTVKTVEISAREAIQIPLMNPSTYYITTPIYYVNAEPHIGSSYTTIMCDILRRYHDLLGFKTYFLTGTDEHGEKIFREAQAKGRDVRQMVDEISQTFRSLWPQLNITNNDFIRTTEKRHIEVVQQILQKTMDSGDIYEAEYGGNYCVACERYYSDRDVEANPGFCPIHESKLEYIMEKNYFFRLRKYQDWLREKIESEPGFLQPEQYRREVLSLLREPLEDLCISRPAERLHWGIPLPFDKNYVTYVWYDALVNYISALEYPDGEKFKTFWPNATHMIAKDILRQHAVYWPCMLKAAGIDCFKRLRVHGYWTAGGKKISKSLGNALDPRDEVARYGLDVFRYFLAREMSFGADGDYNAQALVARNNAELANDLGNLLSRVTAMIEKYCGGVMPAVQNPTEEDTALLTQLQGLADALPGHLENTTMHVFLEKVMQVVAATNRYVTAQAPWTLMKAGNLERVSTVLAVTSQALCGFGQLLYPVMPEKMAALLASYGQGKPERLTLAPVTPGTKIEPAKALFPQLEMAEKPETASAPVADEKVEEKPKPPVAPQKPEIEFDDFAKVDLRVATVLEAERVPKTDKLLRLTVDVGFETRQIVAGIAEHYTPEQMIGRQIVVVANLAPRKLRGLTSQGMLLASRSDTHVFVLDPNGESLPGSEVS
jgi:methionyl-tRNA synthetase